MHAITYTGTDSAAIERTIAQSIAEGMQCSPDKALEQPQVMVIRPEKNKILRKQIMGVVADLSLTTGSDTQRWVVIFSADTMNKEAANALLKLLEEPPLRTTFLLTARSAAHLLPTIRSRTSIVSHANEVEGHDTSELAAAETVGKRFLIIAKHQASKTLDSAYQDLIASLRSQRRYADLKWLMRYDQYVQNVPNYRLLLEAWAVRTLTKATGR